jgi:hypothetical protein
MDTAYCCVQETKIAYRGAGRVQERGWRELEREREEATEGEGGRERERAKIPPLLLSRSLSFALPVRQERQRDRQRQAEAEGKTARRVFLTQPPTCPCPHPRLSAATHTRYLPTPPFAHPARPFSIFLQGCTSPVWHHPSGGGGQQRRFPTPHDISSFRSIAWSIDHKQSHSQPLDD